MIIIAVQQFLLSNNGEFITSTIFAQYIGIIFCGVNPYIYLIFNRYVTEIRYIVILNVANECRVGVRVR